MRPRMEQSILPCRMITQKRHWKQQQPHTQQDSKCDQTLYTVNTLRRSHKPQPQRERLKSADNRNPLRYLNSLMSWAGKRRLQWTECIRGRLTDSYVPHKTDGCKDFITRESAYSNTQWRKSWTTRLQNETGQEIVAGPTTNFSRQKISRLNSQSQTRWHLLCSPESSYLPSRIL